MKARRIPEVIQSSAMDCGPAALAALLNGYGHRVSYPRLREVCQTDVDGTSIDTLEALAVRFGLHAEQIMLPSDCVFLKSTCSLPCIAVTTLPNGLTHFVVMWRERFGFVQIMDPARGRSWMRTDRFLSQLYEHQTVVDAEDWNDYARSDEFCASLTERLIGIGLSEPSAKARMAASLSDGGWQAIANLDAAVRMCHVLLRTSNTSRSGMEHQRLLDTLIDSPELIPDHYRQVIAVSGDEQTLMLKGAILVRVTGSSEPAADDEVVSQVTGHTQLSTPRRLFEVCRTLGSDQLMRSIAASAILIGLITFIEALVFRYLIGAQLPAELPALGLIALVVITPLVAAIALESGGVALSQTLGRRLDLNLRRKLLHKLPRMADGYFASRLVSDLAERGHAVGQIREISELTRRALVLTVRILLVMLGLAWLSPDALWLIGTAIIAALLIPFLIFPVLAERDLRARTHLGALARFYLDSLRGSEAIWAHGAGRSIEQEQEGLLLKWAQAVREFQRPSLLFELLQVLILISIGIALVLNALASALSQGTVLLVAYWAVFVPVLSRQLTDVLKQLPSLASVAQRVLELTDAPEENVGSSAEPRSPATEGATLDFQRLTIRRGDQSLIEDIELHIGSGERIAIVGHSGSGKSSFIGVLLGWHNPHDRDGTLLIDGEPANPESMAALREASVVIDPDLYLWNRSLFDNICYGLDSVGAAQLEAAIAGSELINDLENMEAGLATRSGENGSRLSGGEGQRLRIARGLVRPRPRLVLLDEPFLGMDSAQRLRMRTSVIDRFSGSTILFVSHNVSETLDFERVLVFESGRIVEDGNPRALLSRADSTFARMVAAEVTLQTRLRDGGIWHHRIVEGGVLRTP